MNPKRRRSFIGSDPTYTEAPSVAPPPPATPGPPPATRADAPASQAAPATAPAPDNAGGRAGDASPPTRAPRRAEPMSPPRGESVELFCKVWLDDGLSEVIDQLSERSGLGRNAILRYVRDGVVADFRETLAGEGVPKPLAPTPRRGRGPSVQIRLRLSGRDLEDARRRLDPLDLGRAALTDQAQATIARLYRDRLRRMTERVGLTEGGPGSAV